jgi:FAD/FMN-containing dehydrogenase
MMTGLAGGTALSGLAPATLALSASLPKAEWRRLARSVSGGKLMSPLDDEFHRVALPNNLRYGKALPEAIVRCRTLADVTSVIAWARDNKMVLVTSGGRRSYADDYTTLCGLFRRA